MANTISAEYRALIAHITTVIIAARPVDSLALGFIDPLPLLFQAAALTRCPHAIGWPPAVHA